MDDKDDMQRKPLRLAAIAIIDALIAVMLGIGMLQRNDTLCLKGYDGIMGGGSNYEIYCMPTLFGLFDNVLVVKTTTSSAAHYSSDPDANTSRSYWAKQVLHATIEADLEKIEAEEDGYEKAMRIASLGEKLTTNG